MLLAVQSVVNDYGEKYVLREVRKGILKQFHLKAKKSERERERERENETIEQT